MKIELDIRPIHLAIAFLVIVFLTTSFIQYKRNSGLREDIKERKELIKELKNENSELLQIKQELDHEKTFLIQKVDSFEVQERYYKNKYFVTYEKYKKILGDYNSASTAGKNELFTNAINN